jgi:hypothetical protein
MVKQQREISQVFCYNRSPQSEIFNNTPAYQPDDMEFIHLPEPDIEVEPEGRLFRAVIQGRVTTNGHFLLESCENKLAKMVAAFSRKESQTG